jgi:DNA-binding response OmpR family regulator
MVIAFINWYRLLKQQQSMRGASPGDTMMKRILIVDDESLIGYALSASLRRDDTYIKAVECGKDALSEINHIFYNLCFLDIKLPDACGLDLMKVIKKASPSTFIVIMTGGMVNDPELMKSIVANAHLFISKPFDLERVKSFVNKFIGDGASRPQAGDHSKSWTGYETYENQKHIARQAVMSSTTCAVVASDEEGETSFTAGILEMSDTGMCIRTDYQLKPGQLLRFNDNPVLSTGVVRWSKEGGGEAEDSYHAGVQFVMPEGSLPCTH